MVSQAPLTIAVIGSGIAGAACAHALAQAGHAVQVFDKARGPGGRLATRRAEWTDAQGRAWTTRLDHGAVTLTARSAAFRACLGEAERAGHVAAWAPRVAPAGLPLDDAGQHFLPTPAMAALCRHLLGDTAARWSFAVDRLQRGPLGWQVHAGSESHGTHFDAVLLALPPAQAAPLLGPHRPDWSRHAALALMQPCWTLMGVAQAGTDDSAGPWDLMRPPAGPLAWLLRSDARPGRERVPGQAHWVAHARPGWSRQHLDQPAAWVQAQLQTAVAACLGGPVDWLHQQVHRWRYALPQAQDDFPGPHCWWDAVQGLGVCGDFLGGEGAQAAEEAWLSAQALCAALLASPGRAVIDTPAARDELASPHPARPLAA